LSSWNIGKSVIGTADSILAGLLTSSLAASRRPPALAEIEELVNPFELDTFEPLTPCFNGCVSKEEMVNGKNKVLRVGLAY